MRESQGSNTVAEMVASTGGAAFAIESGGRIVAWNKGAEQLLGHRSCEVVGDSCYAVLAGRDVFGNRYCSSHCPLLDMVARNETVEPFEISVRTASGGRVHTRVDVLATSDGDPGGLELIHVLRPQSATPAIASARATDEPGSGARLTRREKEVLHLMAEGTGTRGMAEALFIGEATVRHHVQSILHKLGVHSRLEAVAKYRRL